MTIEIGTHIFSVSESAVRIRHKNKESFVKEMMAAAENTGIEEQELRRVFEDAYGLIVPKKSKGAR